MKKMVKIISLLLGKVNNFNECRLRSTTSGAFEIKTSKTACASPRSHNISSTGRIYGST